MNYEKNPSFKLILQKRFYFIHLFLIAMSFPEKKRNNENPNSPTRFIYVSIFIPFLESTTFIFSIFHPFLIRFRLKICCRTTIPITYSPPMPPPPKKEGKEKEKRRN